MGNQMSIVTEIYNTQYTVIRARKLRSKYGLSSEVLA